MQSLLRSEISRTLDTKKLRSILPRYVKVARYDSIKAKTLKEAMGRHTVLILLFNIHNKKHQVLNVPGHFFLITTRGPEKCVVFSSTGMRPRKELFITQSDPTLLERILPKGTVYNDVKFQLSKDSNTCWRWLVLYSHLAHLGLKKFQSLFGRPKLLISSPDMLATAMTYILLA